MSIFTPFEDLFQKIKSVVTGIEEHLPDLMAKALFASTELKKLINSTLAVAIVDFTPTTLDNTVRDEISSTIDQVIALLQTGQKCNGDLQCWIDSLKELSPDLQDAVLIKFASKITALLDSNKKDQKYYDEQTQKAYNAISK